jgi:hypothetical protein
MALVLGLLALPLMSGNAAAVAAAPSAAGERESYTSPDHSFTVLVPKDWEKSESGHPYGDLTRITGIRLTGPRTPEGVPALISVLHYSGEHLFRTPEEFIQAQLNAIGRIDYDREATVSSIKMAGRPGKTFFIKTFQLVYLPQPEPPPMKDGVVYELSPPHRQVDLLDRYLVLPASQGYFVLRFRAPETSYKEDQALFEDLAGSFQPLLP